MTPRSACLGLPALQPSPQLLALKSILLQPLHVPEPFQTLCCLRAFALSTGSLLLVLPLASFWLWPKLHFLGEAFPDQLLWCSGPPALLSFLHSTWYILSSC